MKIVFRLILSPVSQHQAERRRCRTVGNQNAVVQIEISECNIHTVFTEFNCTAAVAGFRYIQGFTRFNRVITHIQYGLILIFIGH